MEGQRVGVSGSMESAADERKEDHSHVCPHIFLFWVNSQKGFFFFLRVSSVCCRGDEIRGGVGRYAAAAGECLRGIRRVGQMLARLRIHQRQR